MKHNVTNGKTYLVTAKDETTVTDVESGYVLRVVPANTQAVFVAISNMVETSGECVVSPFANAHLLALGSETGGGAHQGGTEDYVSTKLFNEHTNDLVAHITAEERKAWNAALSGGGTNNPNNCEWALVYMKNTMGDATQPNVTAFESNWSQFMGAASQMGGLLVPLGEYVILVRKPADKYWDDNDFGILVFTPLLNALYDLSSETQVIYFNL